MRKIIRVNGAPQFLKWEEGANYHSKLVFSLDKKVIQLNNGINWLVVY